MVKGISRQVILVKSPDAKLFEQAIFILKEDAQPVSDEALLKEADRVIRGPLGGRKGRMLRGPVWACGGAAATALLWLITSFL